MPPTQPIAGYRAVYARDPLTGEVFAVAAAAPPTAPPPVALDDLSDVDVTATGPTDHAALVWDAALNLWVPGAPAHTLDELTDVTVGPTGPADGEALVWDANSAQWVPGDVTMNAQYGLEIDDQGNIRVDTTILDMRYARELDELDDVYQPLPPLDGSVLTYNSASHKWQPEGSASEVEISPTLPTGPNWELWVDETPIAAPGGAPPVPPFLDELADVDTSTVAPVDREALVWDAAAALWVPGALAIDNLSDVDTTTAAPAEGDVLVFRGGQWKPDVTTSRAMTPSAGAFSGTLKVVENATTITVCGTATKTGLEIPAGGRTIVASWPGGAGSISGPAKMVQFTFTYDGWDPIVVHYQVCLSVEYNGLVVQCFPGQNWPAGRSVDVLMTWTK